MQRRNFILNSGLAALSAGAGLLSPTRFFFKPPKHKMIKPALLTPGSTVSLIAPGSPPKPEKIEKALANLKMLGYTVKEGANLRASNGYLAGSDQQRLNDLHQAFADPDTQAVWCVRGGYGCSRLLPNLNFDLIKKHPKPLIGYSDITALHLAISQKTGLVTFHGPVASGEMPEDTVQHFQAIVVNGNIPYIIYQNPLSAAAIHEVFRPFLITEGKASGPLTGGNLSLLAALVGTAYAPQFRDKIVFIEDIDEQPYRIDRMLTQLLQATDLSKAAGIVLGVCLGCMPKDDSPSLSLEEMFRDRLGHLGIPVAYGFPFGHIDHQATFPYGVQARFDAGGGTLIIGG